MRYTLQFVFQTCHLRPKFAVLTAERGSLPHYTLHIVEPTLAENPAMIDELRIGVERGLSNNPCYQYARQAAQLGHLKLELINENRASLFLRDYTADYVAAGQRLGDVKPLSLISCSR